MKDLKANYKNTGKLDDYGIPILEGSVIIADGYGDHKDMYYCVEFDEDEKIFGSCIYGDFEPLSTYKSIIIKGHCTDYIDLIDDDEFEWSGNLGQVIKYEKEEKVNPKQDLKWSLFKNGMPTEEYGDQIDILFGHPDWGTYVRGMYTHAPEWPMNERLSEYDRNDDRFYTWNHSLPTHFMILPKNPEHEG
jgi:hypothetical protein